MADFVIFLFALLHSIFQVANPYVLSPNPNLLYLEIYLALNVLGSKLLTVLERECTSAHAA